jgi:large conductance mechanosensitive channel
MDPAKKALSLFDEFKSFAFKGNVVDLTVGVILGAAFTTVVKSTVDNLFMPLINWVLPGEEEFRKRTLGPVHIGAFSADLVNFLIVALVLYIFIVKFVGLIMKWRKEEPPPAPLTKDQELLAEICDLLKKERTAPPAAAGAAPE